MPRAHGDCKFRDEWLVLERYKEWVVKDADPRLARCKFCMKSFNIANSGKYALDSHAKAESHGRNVKSRINSPLLAHLKKPELASGHVPAATATVTGELDNFSLQVFGRNSNVNHD